MVKDSERYGRKLKYIKSKLPKRNFYTMHEFFLVCPYSIDELRTTKRNQHVMQWRQVGMFWGTLKDLSLTEVGNEFNRDHATVIHAQKMIILAIDGFHPMLREKLQDVIDCIQIAQHSSHDPNTNVIISSRQIEKLLIKKYNRINRIK